MINPSPPPLSWIMFWAAKLGFVFLRSQCIGINISNKKMTFCVGFKVPLENYSLIWRRRHNCRKVVSLDLCSALMVIEHWGFFSVPHLMRHGASVYNGHLREPVLLTPIANIWNKVSKHLHVFPMYFWKTTKLLYKI